MKKSNNSFNTKTFVFLFTLLFTLLFTAFASNAQIGTTQATNGLGAGGLAVSISIDAEKKM